MSWLFPLCADWFEAKILQPYTEIMYTFCIKKTVQDVCKSCTYTKCTQNVYKMHPTFWKAFAHILYINLKEQYMAAKSSIQNVYKSFLKCGICVYFVYYTSIMIYIYTKST